MFISPNFMFNGILSDNMHIYISQYNTSDIVNDIGISYSENLEKNEIFERNPMYTKGKDEDYEITLELLLYDKIRKVALRWTEDIINTIFDWLITDDFCEFISEDNENLIYYFKVTNIKKHFTFDNKGYIEVTFRSLSKYAYKKIDEIVSLNNITRKYIINNPSRLTYQPIFIITNKGNTQTINKINDFQIVGLNNNQSVVIDNLTCTVQDNDTKENLFSKCNRKWISMPSGENVFTLSGNMEIRIIARFPVIP